MIERLLERARRRAQAADAFWRRAERTSVAFEWGRLKAAGVSEEAGANLRVVHGGRAGHAGTTATADADVDGLVTRALASAELGERLELAFPGPAALPAVGTSYRTAADARLDDLIRMGRLLVERLERPDCQVNVAIEREISETRVANTAGIEAAYRSTSVAVSAEVWRIAGDDVLTIGDAFEGADLPAADALEALTRSVGMRLDQALRVVKPPEGSLPVIFTPPGLSAVLLPVMQGLSGKAVLQGISPLAGKVGEQIFDTTFSLTDDPLVPGRAGSRPLDDEGVLSATLPLVERGVVRRFIYDLETAARARAASTGHGQRGTFGKPVPGYTNLILGSEPPGAWDAGGGLGGGLTDGITDGLIVDELIGVGQGNVVGGAFSHPVALAYCVERGEVTGRVKDAAVAGNVYDLLRRIGGFGKDGRWMGRRFAPSVLLEGVSIARR